MGTTSQPGRPQVPPLLEEKRRFVLSTIDVLAQETLPYISSIIGVLDAKTGRHAGSGLRCILGGRRALITAAHVIDQALQEPGGAAISTGYGGSPYLVGGQINVDRISDIAVYFLPDDFPTDRSLAFWPSERIDRELTRLSTDYLFTHGFPDSQSYSSQLLNGVLSKSLPYGAMQRLESLPRDMQPFQFAIEYDPVGMADPAGGARELVDPHGLSGSPVWRIGASGRAMRDWRPSDSVLVGVLTQWRPDEKVLVATSTSKLPPQW